MSKAPPGPSPHRAPWRCSEASTAQPRGAGSAGHVGGPGGRRRGQDPPQPWMAGWAGMAWEGSVFISFFFRKKTWNLYIYILES